MVRHPYETGPNVENYPYNTVDTTLYSHCATFITPFSTLVKSPKPTKPLNIAYVEVLSGAPSSKLPKL